MGSSISVVEKGTVLVDYFEDSEEEDLSTKVILKNDGLSIAAAESCGSGVLYWEDGKYHWFQTS